MTAVTIVQSHTNTDDETYWAIAPEVGMQTVGRTAGQALDALTAQLDTTASQTLIVVQRREADSFFTQEQKDRLQYLMVRAATPEGLSTDEEAERENLIEQELLASARRTAALADALGR